MNVGQVGLMQVRPAEGKSRTEKVWEQCGVLWLGAGARGGSMGCRTGAGTGQECEFYNQERTLDSDFKTEW